MRRHHFRVLALGQPWLRRSAGPIGSLLARSATHASGQAQSLVTGRFRAFQKCPDGGLAPRMQSRPSDGESPACVGNAIPALRWHAVVPKQAQPPAVSEPFGSSGRSRCLHRAAQPLDCDNATPPSQQSTEARCRHHA